MRKQLGLVLAAILGVLMMGGDVLGQVVIFTNPITGTDPGLINPYTTGQVITVDGGLTLRRDHLA